jgi:hypothetical protein
MKNHFFMQRSENEEKRPDLAEKNHVFQKNWKKD